MRVEATYEWPCAAASNFEPVGGGNTEGVSTALLIGDGHRGLDLDAIAHVPPRQNGTGFTLSLLSPQLLAYRSPSGRHYISNLVSDHVGMEVNVLVSPYARNCLSRKGEFSLPIAEYSRARAVS